MNDAPERLLRGVVLATPTGLEPAASAVTGRRANQLRYGALLLLRKRTNASSHPRCLRIGGEPAGDAPPTGFEPVLPP